MKRKISIIIPAYNEEKYLLSALESIEKQTFDHNKIETIVVNNASTDRTAEVFNSFVGKNSFKMLMIEEPVLGVSRAKNKGASIAEGKILIFLDADSQMSENLVQVVNDYYEQGYLMGIIRLVPESDNFMARFLFKLIDFGKDKFHVTAQMGYCDREIFWKAGGFRSELKHAEDLELFTKIKKLLKKEGKKFCYIKEAFIVTSTRRMDRLPMRLGYLLTFFEWFFGGFLGLRRKSYKPYR
ncbi:glycosyltransferase [Candidatus Aminicenantes bacterium AC-335-K20]|jgi:glycosyltransferase involved in cell wall biosynthesis|nr:glycosyltransferase [SCandidatus Aminicenantes bacterium Aminicenantia_JdfR_composite]MCP2596720.1 glycosyltransferase [Candidatus Aminicenantes bacterium AC-335-G13]MCP2605968.1 glycosyltransferase [Candidatus Aminicenantes bacterium AC-708-I09]MCP2618510.1 glycosyltransferase [Candidatus Aminicenantes bacterium AC-335-A11]MCP2619286.1 glycosyltransferase [Candidatus Aminicenantes bacterium AC-335-K20]MCP2620412.1 glycosyltransferase [Candidatus Aminicenantes bacterium AC-334-E05]